MARESRTRTHLENLVIIPKSAHGDADGDNALVIYPINSDDISGSPTAAFRVTENGDVWYKSLNMIGGAAAALGAILGTTLDLTDDTTEDGDTALIKGNTIKAGNALKIFMDTDIVTTGKAINVISGANYAAATSKFSVNDDGNVVAAGTLDVTGNTTLVSLDVGGGSGGSGATITALGAGTFDAGLTADTLVIGGGYSSSGLSVANTGALTCASTALFDGAITSGKVGSAGSFVAWGTTDGSIAVVPIAAGTNLTTIQNQTGGSAKVITLPSATCTLPGLGLANAFTAVQTITVTGVTDASLMGLYSNVNQTTLATANDLTAVRGNARIDVDSASGKAIGGYFLAGNTTAGFNVSVVRGIYCGTVCKTPTAADKTWTDVRGIEIVTGNTAIGATYKTDVTNLMGIRLKIGSSTGSGTDVCGDITNGYGVWVDHEQQGLACRTLDAGFYLSATSISGGNAAWAYGLDMSAVGANMGTADIRFSNGLTFFVSADAITATSTVTTLPAGSLGITSNGTGVGHLFVSDGAHWQYCAVA